jgi:DnaA family protein
VRQLALGVRLRADAVFESFAPGFNTEIISALHQPNSEPLWIWGGKGSGKTHLLQAVCAAAGEAAAYFPLDRSLALPPQALRGFEACRALCVDDVDAVAGDLPWETALFDLFNAAVELRTRLIFAASVPPRQPPWCLKDWQSRAAQETSEYLLKRVPRDLRSLLEILDELDEASLAAQRRLTIPFIRDALEKYAGKKS